MADLTTWGMLAKSAIDSETVEQAIDRIVLAHNGSAVAHTLAGQSIAVHRENDVLDHPAGSVVGDKLVRSHIFETDFSLLGSGWLTGNGTSGAGGIYLYTTASSGNSSYLEDVPKGWSGVNFNKNSYVRILAKIVSTTNQDIVMGVGVDMDGDGLMGYGFKIHDNILYAYHADTPGSTPVFTTIQITGLTLTAWHVYEIMFDPVLGTLTFFIDGDQVAQFTSGLPTGEDDGSFVFQIKTNTASARYMYIGNFYLSVDY